MNIRKARTTMMRRWGLRVLAERGAEVVRTGLGGPQMKLRMPDGRLVQVRTSQDHWSSLGIVKGAVHVDPALDAFVFITSVAAGAGSAFRAELRFVDAEAVRAAWTAGRDHYVAQGRGPRHVFWRPLFMSAAKAERHRIGGGVLDGIEPTASVVLDPLAPAAETPCPAPAAPSFSDALDAAKAAAAQALGLPLDRIDLTIRA